jgi:electron transport complex protein RnfB
VDCISLENTPGERTGWSAWSQPEADNARLRYEFHSYKRTQNVRKGTKKLEELAPRQPAAQPETPTDAAQRKSAMIEAVLARSRAQRTAKP